EVHQEQIGQFYQRWAPPPSVTELSIGEQQLEVEGYSIQSVHRFNAARVMDVTMLKGPVLLKIVKQAVFNIPAPVHDAPYRFRLHLHGVNRRDDVLLPWSAGYPTPVLVVFPHLTHLEATQGFANTIPAGEPFFIPQLHLVTSPRFLIRLTTQTRGRIAQHVVR